MATYKFAYLNAMGIGEPCRYIFAIAGQEYEDIRIEFADLPKFKEGAPLGQLPFLEVDGEIIPQSVAISRYLARKFDLYGESDIEKARIDVILDVLNIDFRPYIVKILYEKDEATKKKFLQELTDVQAPRYLGILEKLLIANQGGDGFFVGSKISLADIYVFNFVHDKLAIHKITIKEPKLQAFKDRIKALPQIDAWLKKRPKTDV